MYLCQYQTHSATGWITQIVILRDPKVLDRFLSCQACCPTYSRKLRSAPLLIPKPARDGVELGVCPHCYVARAFPVTDKVNGNSNYDPKMSTMPIHRPDSVLQPVA